MQCQAANCYQKATHSFPYSNSKSEEFVNKLDRSIFLCPECQNSKDQAEIWLKYLLNEGGYNIDIPVCWLSLIEKFSPKPKMPLTLYRGIQSSNFTSGENLFEKTSFWSTSKDVAKKYTGKKGSLLQVKISDPNTILLDTRGWNGMKDLSQKCVVLKAGKYVVQKIKS